MVRAVKGPPVMRPAIGWDPLGVAAAAMLVKETV